MKNTIELQVEEIESETNPIKKNQLLQKYGLVEPKLTTNEKAVLQLEEQGTLTWETYYNGWRV